MIRKIICYTVLLSDSGCKNKMLCYVMLMNDWTDLSGGWTRKSPPKYAHYWQCRSTEWRLDLIICSWKTLNWSGSIESSARRHLVAGRAVDIDLTLPYLLINARLTIAIIEWIKSLKTHIVLLFCLLTHVGWCPNLTMAYMYVYGNNGRRPPLKLVFQ